ncbi:putative T7SS-secreted protein [Leifsonia sp. AG29]|uniref:putative T7SS-secreted protein n=1 Tax=Leifsonia sp. AG29 TaxID=2598860 RepID=UPI00131B01EA|nr:hypothetical protein [Leifsonia sp. AG29]
MGDREYEKLTGRPDLVRSKAEHYEQIAAAITRSVAALNRISEVGGMTSKAVDAVKKSAADVADDINKAQDRYQVTAAALKTYAGHLQQAQDDADKAIALIGPREDAADQAQHRAASAQHTLDTGTPEAHAANQLAATRAGDAASAASQELQAAQQAWRDARDAKDRAAETASGRIKDVVEGKGNHGLEDSFWDDWGDIIKTICQIAGVLSLFLSWVPILGQILLVIAVVGAVITLVESVVKAMNGGSWVDVAFAAVGLVLTVFGANIGKYIGNLVKAKGLTVAMKLPRRQFTLLTGISKGSKAAELKDVQAMLGSPKVLPNVMKEVFGKNPFKLTTGPEGLLKLQRNPLGLAGFDNPQFAAKVMDEIPTGYKVALKVWNYRAVAGKIQTLTDNPLDPNDKPLSLKPESIAKDLADGRLPKWTLG